MIDSKDSEYKLFWTVNKSMRRMMDEVIFWAMAHHGSQTKAARSLGISVRTLRTRIYTSPVLIQFRLKGKVLEQSKKATH